MSSQNLPTIRLILALFLIQAVSARAQDAPGSGDRLTSRSETSDAWTAGERTPPGYSWFPLGSGVNDSVLALAVFNNDLIVGGSFTTAGGLPANRIARWDGTAWSPLGSGVDGTVQCLCVYNNQLIVGGSFTHAGGQSAMRVASWNGTSWQPLGTGVNGTAYALVVFSNRLYVGGEFSIAGGNSVGRIASWDGSWHVLPSVNNPVQTAVVANSRLYIGGSFTKSGSTSVAHVARWDGSNWQNLSSGTNGTVYALTYYGTTDLIAGGDFTTPFYYVAHWDGNVNSWYSMSGSLNNVVRALTIFNNIPVAGTADNIKLWSGSGWVVMGNGVNGSVYAVIPFREGLVAGGSFTTAGGAPASQIVYVIQDCNQNHIPDAEDIAFGTSADCDSNGLPDECQPDCNDNEIADACDIAQHTSQDCSSDGIPDECEADCDSNGLPNVCEIAFCNGDPACEDCNQNGTPDGCDITAQRSHDCNSDGIPDDCQLVDNDCDSNGVPDDCEADCDSNGIADECELSPVLHAKSGQFSPFDHDHPASYTLSPAPTALSDVTLTFKAIADFGETNEWVYVYVNDLQVGFAFLNGAHQCPVSPDVATLTVPMSTYNSLISGGSATFLMAPPFSVEPLCLVSYISIEVSYSLYTADCDGNLVLDVCQLATEDCNDNNVVDSCDIAQGTATDCNGTGLPDSCDVSLGYSLDCNSNGLPDSCDPDCNSNGLVDSCETLDGTTPDCDFNGIPDSCDIAANPSLDGDQNGIPDACEIAEVVVYLVSPQAESGTGRTPAEAAEWGHAPILSNPDCYHPLNATIEVWMRINPVGPNFQAIGYTMLRAGGFDIAGENESVKGASLNLFRTYNTDVSQLRWDGNSSDIGSTGGAGYLWRGTYFNANGYSGANSKAGQIVPAGPDSSAADWKLATLTISVPNAGTILGGEDSFFDVYLEMPNIAWSTQPTPTAHLALGWDDQTESFIGDGSLVGRRSHHPDLRIRTRAPNAGPCPPRAPFQPPSIKPDDPFH